MEYEIELKLLTNERAGEIIETKLLPQLNANVTQKKLVLANHYFDTPDRVLRQHDIGLRIRGNNQKCEQTLKTAGMSIGGLHQRPEYNVQLDESKKQIVKIPELSLFPVSAWPKTINVDDLQANIETLFTTHFERKIYLLEFVHGDIVELVWDLGEVRSGDKSVPICEIELELREGSTASLFNLAKRIVTLLPTAIGTDSKAARGYCLIDGLPIKEFKQYQHSLPANILINSEVFARLLSTQLADFQMLCADLRNQYSDKLAIKINHVLICLVDNLTGFNRHFPCPSLDHIIIRTKTLLNDWSLVVGQNNKKFAIRVLTQPQTTQMQLDIVQFLVEQPWSLND